MTTTGLSTSRLVNFLPSFSIISPDSSDDAHLGRPCFRYTFDHSSSLSKVETIGAYLNQCLEETDITNSKSSKEPGGWNTYTSGDRGHSVRYVSCFNYFCSFAFFFLPIWFAISFALAAASPKQAVTATSIRLGGFFFLACDFQ